MKVNSNLQPLIHLPDVFNRAEKKKYQMVEQLILRVHMDRLWGCQWLGGRVSLVNYALWA